MLSFGLQLTASQPRELLRPWFEGWLGLAMPRGATPGEVPDPAVAVHDYLTCVMALTARVLRAGRVPVFEAGRILECVPLAGKAGHWQARVALPAVDLVDRTCYQIAAHAALAGADQMMHGQPADPASREAIAAPLAAASRRIGALSASGKSTMAVLAAVHARGIPFLHLGSGVYQLGWGSRGVRSDRSTTARDSALGARLAQSKHDSAALLRAAGLPAPVHGLVRRRNDALPLAHRLGWPLVVKPADGDRGEGVTVDVQADETLLEAFDRALAASARRQVLIERQVAGVCHRIFIAAGRLLYAVKRLPKSVIGDGKSTVAMLIAQANRAEQARPPWDRTELFPDDAQALEALRRAGYRLDSVPPARAIVPLRRIESTAEGGHDEDVTTLVHPENLDVAVRTAELFDLDVAGVDIISADIAVPWHRNGAIINEVNYSPLLGGGEISRRHLPEFVRRLIEGDGRIPIEAVLDPSPELALARARQSQLCGRGLRCHLVSAARVLLPDGTERVMPQTGLAGRCRALLLDRRVDALVIAVASREELDALPFANEIAGVG